MVLLNGESKEMSGFNSSDDECEVVDRTPLKIDWLDLEFISIDEKLGISALPGCRFMDTWRSLQNDITYIKNAEVRDVFCLCTNGELWKYRVPRFIEAFEEAGISIHHIDFLDGTAPKMPVLLKLLDELKVCILNGRKSLIHCFGGLGRSCLVAACLLMILDESITPEQAINKIREVRGPAAIQSVKQYNFINDFRIALVKHYTEYDCTEASVSR